MSTTSPLYITNNEESMTNVNNRYQRIILVTEVVTVGFVHTFLLSIFETIFYWTYVIKKENHVIKKQINNIKVLIATLCQNVPNHYLDLDKLESSLEKERYESNNTFSLYVSIYLCVSLFLISTLFIFLISYQKYLLNNNKFITIFLHEIRSSIYKSMFPFVCMCIYETMFFQLVVNYYSPGNLFEYSVIMSNSCLNNQ